MYLEELVATVIVTVVTGAIITTIICVTLRVTLLNLRPKSILSNLKWIWVLAIVIAVTVKSCWKR